MPMVERELTYINKQIAEKSAGGWKGVPLRPKSNALGACSASAARNAEKHGVTFYVVPTYYGMTISCRDDAKNSYTDFGGWKFTADGRAFINERKV